MRRRDFGRRARKRSIGKRANCEGAASECSGAWLREDLGNRPAAVIDLNRAAVVRSVFARVVDSHQAENRRGVVERTVAATDDLFAFRIGCADDEISEIREPAFLVQYTQPPTSERRVVRDLDDRLD